MTQYNWAPSPQLVKNINKHTVLDLIRFTPGGISRAELAQRMDLSRAAMTAIVNDLIKCDAIRETESRNKHSGRPPIILEVNAPRGHVIGIDMGASHLSIILADFAAQVLDEIEVPFRVADGPELCVSTANNLVEELLKKNQFSNTQISAIGLGVPGPIASESGMVYAPPIMPGWDGYPIQANLEQHWGLPVSLNNDAELGALGEWAYGAGRGEKNLAFIKVGSGIGAGLIINQQIYCGTTGSAGEIGHLTIDENGPLCSCGNRGCMEAFAGGHAIALQARKMVESGKRTLLSNIPIENLTAEDVANAARRGDLPSQEIIMRAGTFIGIAIAGLVNLFNPGAVIIGGGVAQVGDLLTTSIRKAVRERSLRASEQSVRITTAMLGQRSSLMGATVQAINIAIHDAIERKNPVSKNVFSAEIKQDDAV
jgi:glucokinase-like ROK family protein